MDDPESQKLFALPASRDAKIIFALGVVILSVAGFFAIFAGGLPVFIWVPAVFTGICLTYLGLRRRCLVFSAISAISFNKDNKDNNRG